MAILQDKEMVIYKSPLISSQPIIIYLPRGTSGPTLPSLPLFDCICYRVVTPRYIIDASCSAPIYRSGISITRSYTSFSYIHRCTEDQRLKDHGGLFCLIHTHGT